MIAGYASAANSCMVRTGGIERFRDKHDGIALARKPMQAAIGFLALSLEKGIQPDCFKQHNGVFIANDTHFSHTIHTASLG